MSNNKTTKKQTIRSSAAKPKSGKQSNKPAAATHRPKARKFASKAEETKFHKKSSEASETAWVTIAKLRALAYAAAKAGKGKPKAGITSKASGREYFVTDKQYRDAVAKVKAERAK